MKRADKMRATKGKGKSKAKPCPKPKGKAAKLGDMFMNQGRY
jgi:hypothetical protein